MQEKRGLPQAGEIYRHFKGNLYRIVTVAEHTETGEQLVIYQALYGEMKVYARPLQMFLSPTDREKYPDAQQAYRFEKVEGPGVVLPGAAPSAAGQAAAPGTSFGGAAAGNGTGAGSGADAGGDPSAKAGPDPLVLEFLDEASSEKRLEILTRIRPVMTKEMLRVLAFSLDLEIPEDLQAAFDIIQSSVETRWKFEGGQRLR
ncbi:MAG: DUF1653 domain-containing protein [Lachnospiraceae bacterium]|nr:DUF1653 domain-containing protein [Lachnospiraceae bacterium]